MFKMPLSVNVPVEREKSLKRTWDACLTRPYRGLAPAVNSLCGDYDVVPDSDSSPITPTPFRVTARFICDYALRILQHVAEQVDPDLGLSRAGAAVLRSLHADLSARLLQDRKSTRLNSSHT